ncbi:hypothetical protein AB0J35_57000 [Nonomuraea angiospora]|uniref:hypothetical protein n=1 Tax=Nonomuraea angiospora TaxID=46172 RepID=UPI00343D126E
MAEEPKDVVAIEKTHGFGGTFSTIDGIGLDDLHIRKVMARLARDLASADLSWCACNNRSLRQSPPGRG